jgi:hypothetical protein
MSLTTENITSLITLASPLDQFGADSFGNDIISLLKCSFLDSIDIFGLDELLDVSFLQGLFATFVSTYFYDDDDCADSE